MTVMWCANTFQPSGARAASFWWEAASSTNPVYSTLFVGSPKESSLILLDNTLTPNTALYVSLNITRTTERYYTLLCYLEVFSLVQKADEIKSGAVNLSLSEIVVIDKPTKLSSNTLIIDGCHQFSSTVCWALQRNIMHL